MVYDDNISTKLDPENAASQHIPTMFSSYFWSVLNKYIICYVVAEIAEKKEVILHEIQLLSWQ